MIPANEPPTQTLARVVMLLIGMAMMAFGLLMLVLLAGCTIALLH